MTTERECEIVDLKASSTKRDGTPLLTRTGKPMWRVQLQISERPGMWIDGLSFSDPAQWKGTKKKLILYTEEYQGQAKPKFKLPASPRGGGISNEKVDEMIALLRSIDLTLKQMTLS